MRSRTTILAAALAALLLAGCAAAAPVREPVDVPATTARAAAVSLTLSTADVRLAGAAEALVEGAATYPGSDGKMQVVSGSRESTAGTIATVGIVQGKVAMLTPGQRLVDLKLNGGLPLDLSMEQESGNADLDLSLADVKDLDVACQTGGLGIRLSGPHPSLSRASLSLESGDTSITANGEYPAIEAFKVRSGSGDVRLDLGGSTWRKSFTASVDARSGDVTLVLPRTVNVRVLGSPGSGSTSAEGFVQAGEGWERAADKPSESTLTVEVTLTSGKLVLQVPAGS